MNVFKNLDIFFKVEISIIYSFKWRRKRIHQTINKSLYVLKEWKGGELWNKNFVWLNGSFYWAIFKLLSRDRKFFPIVIVEKT